MRTDIRKQMNEYLVGQGIPKTTVAKALDISPATFSLWLQNNYNGDDQRISEVVAQFLELQKEKLAAPKGASFKMTRAAKVVFDSCRMAHVVGRINVIVSKAGYGKTIALQEYAWENSHNVLIIHARPTQQAFAMLYEIAKKLRISVRGKNDFLFARIVEKLTQTPKLLIFDEAQSYNYRTLETIRRIHDISGAGVVLSGSYRLYDQMLGGDLKDYDQLFSRVVRRELPPLNTADVLLLLSEKVPDINGDDVKKLLDLCQGSARYLSEHVKLAEHMFKGQKVRIREIEQAHKYLMVRAA